MGWLSVSGAVPGGPQAEGAGAADPDRVHPAVGGGRHQDSGLRSLHESGVGAEPRLGGKSLRFSFQSPF